ncbi:MAG: cell division protein FtsA [Candidatus Omnitrophica bacterium]|nr:cell division protein FtsA [Candidatus Omnitrophota bacterium]
MLNNYICGLDLGTSKISACLAEIKKNRISSLYFESAPSKGLKRGSIVDSVAFVNSVSGVLKGLKSKSGINFKSVYANVSGQDIITKHSRAIIPITERGNKVITAQDLDKVNEQALILGSNLEEEIIHKIPYSYNIDSKANIVNPLGLYSHKLEADLYLVCGKLSSLQSLTHAINQSGFEIKDLSLSGLASSEAVFSGEYKTGINVLCDIGADITEVLIFRDGSLYSIDILSQGGSDLTEGLAETLNIPFDFAEEIKVSYGLVGDSSQIKEEKEILVKKDSAYKPIKQKMVCDIITEKAKFLCRTLKETIEKRVSRMDVENVVVCGRTILQEGFLETLENTLGIKARTGRIQNTNVVHLVGKSEALSGQKYLAYITALGIVCQAMHEYRPMIVSISQPIRNPILKAINKVKNVYQEYF